MTHGEANELLPWYANRTLSEGEHRAVEQHLAGCAECQRELEEVRAMQAAEIRLTDEIPPAPPFLMTRAIARLDARPPLPLWIRWALAAQFAAVLALSVVAYRAYHPPIRTLSGGDGDGAGVRIGIVFDPGTSESAMRQVLIEHKGSIVRGPSAQGLYIVAFSIEESRADALIDALPRNPAIRFAQRSR